MSLLTNRRAPYPFDTRIDGKPYMLGADEKGGKLVAIKPQDLGGVAPNTYSYSAQNPTIERVTPYEPLVRGYGRSRQTDFQDKAYHWAENMDLSVEPYWLKGPKLYSFTPAVKDKIVTFMEVGTTLWAVGGRYAHKRTSDADWDTGVKDFGLNKVAVDAVSFWSNGLAAAYGYVAMGDTEPIWRWSATGGWEQHAEASKIYSRAFQKVGNDLYSANSVNQLALVNTDADPFVVANWSATNQHLIGDKSSGITRLAITPSGVLLVFKTDGIYTLDPNGNTINLFPQLRMPADDDNGLAWATFLDDIYVSYREACFLIDPSFTLEDVGVGRLTSNTSPVKGRYTALCADGNNCLYGTLWNPDTGDSYLVKYGGWKLVDDPTSETMSLWQRANNANVRIAVWNGSIATVFTGKKITAMHKSTAGAPTGHARIYLGADDGTIYWFTLPCTANPLNCDEYEFSTADGYVHLPTWTANFPNEGKLLRAVTVRALEANNANYAQVQYKLNPLVATYTAMPGNHDTVPRKKVNFPDGTTATEADLKVKVVGNPIITGMGLHHRVQSDMLKIFTLNVLAEDGLISKDGTPLRRGAVAIDTEIETLASAGGSFEVVLPDGRDVIVSLVGYIETTSWVNRLRRWVRSMALTLAEQATVQTKGQLQHLEGMTLAQMEGYTLEQLEYV